MRSVLTILLLLILIGFILLYIMGRIPTLESFRGSEGYGGWWGFSATSHVTEEPEAIVIKEQPCSTDFDCSSGHCGMFGMCTNGLSLPNN
jgi:hypothetical protein